MDILLPTDEKTIDLPDPTRFMGYMKCEETLQRLSAELFVALEKKRRELNCETVNELYVQYLDALVDSIKLKADAWNKEIERVKEESRMIDHARMALHYAQLEELMRNDDVNRSPIEYKLEQFIVAKKPKWVKRLDFDTPYCLGKSH